MKESKDSSAKLLIMKYDLPNSASDNRFSYNQSCHSNIYALIAETFIQISQNHRFDEFDFSWLFISINYFFKQSILIHISFDRSKRFLSRSKLFTKRLFFKINRRYQIDWPISEKNRRIVLIHLIHSKVALPIEHETLRIEHNDIMSQSSQISDNHCANYWCLSQQICLYS